GRRGSPVAGWRWGNRARLPPDGGRRGSSPPPIRRWPNGSKPSARRRPTRWPRSRSDPRMIPPGSTIGILGGGQLGRMLAMAAAQLGYRCHVYAPEKDSVAADVSARFTRGDWHDRQALAGFAQDCAVVTYEFENVPVAPLSAIPEGRLAPGPRALEVAQDRLREKRF